MTSYGSLAGELADLMRQADLDDKDMRPAARVRRHTVIDVAPVERDQATFLNMMLERSLTIFHTYPAPIPGMQSDPA